MITDFSLTFQKRDTGIRLPFNVNFEVEENLVSKKVFKKKK